MTTLEILTLAVVQGVAEFLPISSSGHLVVVSALFHAGDATAEAASADVNIVLHGGTLISILVFYWRRIWRLIGADRRVIPLLIVGTIPAAVLGVIVKTQFESLLESPLLAGCMLPVTGLMLLLISGREGGEDDYSKLSYKAVLVIGCFQAFALLPGISRSGSTIVAGLLVGLHRRAAATFSFLLAIPVIGGATVLELKDLVEAKSLDAPPSLLLAGAVVAFAVGLVSLAWLIRWIERGKLHYFAYWVIPLGLAIVVWQLMLLASGNG
ncbi:MAG: undecaprenyl-diphosphate phosphatase [Pirellulaceae bacterium]|nr:undecaprenyl-diphosphate phosphatase [Planctomycetales bacterium]